MEHGSRTRLVTALVLVVVFGSGVLLGFVADSNLGATTVESADEIANSAEADEPRSRTRLYDQVDPTEVQRTQIDSIVSEHRALTNALDEQLRGEYRAGFKVILLETREAIKGVFTPQQAAEYQRLLEEWDARPAEARGNRDERD